MFSVQQRPDSFEGALYNRVLLLVCLPILNLFFVRAKIGFVSPSLVHHLSKVFGAVLSQVQALLFFPVFLRTTATGILANGGSIDELVFPVQLGYG